MNNWRQKLEALLEGLHIVDPEKFINEGEVGDYRTLGEMLYENGKVNHKRIEELEMNARFLSFLEEHCDNLGQNYR